MRQKRQFNIFNYKEMIWFFLLSLFLFQTILFISTLEYTKEDTLNNGKEGISQLSIVPEVSNIGLIDHAPISIDGDSALDAFCSGNGTNGSYFNPHIIENLYIDALYESDGINIYSTTKYLEIRNCTIINSATEWGVGMAGIYIGQASNILFINNTLEGNFMGIGVGGGSFRNIKIINNTFIENDNSNIYVQYTANLIIKNNSFYGHSFEAIRVFDCDGGIFEGNKIYGIFSRINFYGGCENNIIRSNLFLNTSIKLNLYENYENSNNLIYLNCFSEPWEILDNSVNLWDNGTHGNYWEDYSEKYPSAEDYGYYWSIPYQINETNFDHFPLISIDVASEANTGTESYDFLIGFESGFSQPLTTSSVIISWQNDIHAFADNFTLLISTALFTSDHLKNALLPWDEIEIIFINKTPNMENWYEITDFENGVYYIALCYTSGSESGSSNILELVVEIESPIEDPFKESYDFLIEFESGLSQPLTISSVIISWPIDIHSIADNFTLLISNASFTQDELKNGPLPWDEIEIIFIDNTPNMENWYEITNLENGVYYIALCYTNGSESGSSNILELVVELGSAKKDPFADILNIPGYSWSILIGSMIITACFVFIKSKKLQYHS